MYGTVGYFSNYLVESMMNRLVNEQVHSLKDCYKHLQTEIESLKESAETKSQYLYNLHTAYQQTSQNIIGMREKDED